jgi:hypothetical protein
VDASRADAAGSAAGELTAVSPLDAAALGALSAGWFFAPCIAGTMMIEMPMPKAAARPTPTTTLRAAGELIMSGLSLEC